MARIGFLVLTSLILASSFFAQAFAQSDASTPVLPKLQWSVSTTGTNASLRGLSVVDSQTLWASGAAGTVIRSSDGGASWIPCGPAEFKELEFRSIAAFDTQVACIASAGTPAVILRTSDGGKTWRKVFSHPSASAFFDGLRFWDAQHGLAFSDPVEGRLLVVRTKDGGLSWQAASPESIPAAQEKEAGFAASNSSLRLGADGLAWLGTGGTQSLRSRIYVSQDFGATWSLSECPLPSGASEGVFSIVASADAKLIVAVGGDYRPEATSKLTAAWSIDRGKTWQPAVQPPEMFVSAVCSVPSDSPQQESSATNGQQLSVFVATGPAASYLSVDGKQWSEFSKIGFHAIESTTTRAVFAVGSEGRFGKLQLGSTP